MTFPSKKTAKQRLSDAAYDIYAEHGLEEALMILDSRKMALQVIDEVGPALDHKLRSQDVARQNAEYGEHLETFE